MFKKKLVDKFNNKLRSFELIKQQQYKSPNNKRVEHLINSSYFNFNSNNLKYDYNLTIKKKKNIKKKKKNNNVSKYKSIVNKNKNKLDNIIKKRTKIKPKIPNKKCKLLDIKMKETLKKKQKVEMINSLKFDKKFMKQNASFDKKKKKFIDFDKKKKVRKKLLQFNGYNVKNKKKKSNYNSEEKKNTQFNDKIKKFNKMNKSLEKKIDLYESNNYNNPTYLKNKLDSNDKFFNEEELEKQAKEIFHDLIKESPDILLLKQEIKSQFNNNWEENPIFNFHTKIEYYNINKLIGKGNFGKVYLGIQKLTNRPVAIKIISKKKLKTQESKKKVDLEVKILKLAFGQKNIIQFFEMFENEKYIFMIFEFCGKGDLLNNLREKGVYDEDKAKIIIYYILKGIKHLHSLNILHRDIKLENILMDNNNVPKIADFGISMLVKDNEIIVDTAGTPAYWAPEIIKAEGETSFKSDIWSLGIFLFAIIFGKVPFKSSNLQDLYKLIIRGKWNFPSNCNISKNLSNLIKRMLTYSIKERISVEESLNHPWFLENSCLGENIKDNKINFDNLNQLKKNISIWILNKLGFPKNFIIQSLKSQIFNHASACFYNIYENLDFI